MINYVLGNIGRTVLYGMDPQLDPPSTFSDLQGLVAEMASGAVDLLFVHHADLVGAMPPGLLSAEAIRKVPLVVSFSDHLDATTALAHRRRKKSRSV